MALDLSRDWAIIDDPITVTLSVHQTEGVWGAPQTVTGAQRNEIEQEDIEADNGLLGQDATVYHLWTVKLGSTVPKVTDLIAQGSTTYKVRSVGMRDRDSTGVQRYRLVCVRSDT